MGYRLGLDNRTLGVELVNRNLIPGPHARFLSLFVVGGVLFFPNGLGARLNGNNSLEVLLFRFEL